MGLWYSGKTKEKTRLIIGESYAWSKCLFIKGLGYLRGVIPHIPNLLFIKHLDQGIFLSTICCVSPLFTYTYQDRKFAIGHFKTKWRYMRYILDYIKTPKLNINSSLPLHLVVDPIIVLVLIPKKRYISSRELRWEIGLAPKRELLWFIRS